MEYESVVVRAEEPKATVAAVRGGGWTKDTRSPEPYCSDSIHREGHRGRVERVVWERSGQDRRVAGWWGAHRECPASRKVGQDWGICREEPLFLFLIYAAQIA